jgi:tetratricopeptide (TPR) repeat protein
MSVIFNALKRLEPRSAAEKKKSNKLTKGRRIYSLRRMLFSPRVVLLVGMFVFFVGLGALYGVRNLKGYIEENNQKPIISGGIKPKSRPYKINKETHGPVKEVACSRESRQYPTEPEEAPDSVDIPPSQNIVSDEVSDPDGVYLPPGGLKIDGSETCSEKKMDAHYLPPRRYSQRPGSSVSNLGSEVLSKAVTKSNPPSVPLPSALTKEKSSLSPAAELLEKPVIKAGAEKTELELIHQANVDKNMKIARLVEKIQRSIRLLNASHTQDLFDQLTLLKGEDDPYVLNLKAFWSLCHKDYETTAAYLKKVLEQNEVDFDAGINMAVVEISTNQLQAARKRLARLRKIYPDNVMIMEMIQKLK